MKFNLNIAININFGPADPEPEPFEFPRESMVDSRSELDYDAKANPMDAIPLYRSDAPVHRPIIGFKRED